MNIEVRKVCADTVLFADICVARYCHEIFLFVSKDSATSRSFMVR